MSENSEGLIDTPICPRCKNSLQVEQDNGPPGHPLSWLPPPAAPSWLPLLPSALLLSCWGHSQGGKSGLLLLHSTGTLGETVGKRSQWLGGAGLRHLGQAFTLYLLPLSYISPLQLFWPRESQCLAHLLPPGSPDQLNTQNSRVNQVPPLQEACF